MSKELYIKNADLILDADDYVGIALELLARTRLLDRMRYSCMDRHFYEIKPILHRDGTPVLTPSGYRPMFNSIASNDWMRAVIRRFLYGAFKRDRSGAVVRFNPTSKHVSQTLDALRSICTDRKSWGIAA